MAAWAEAEEPRGGVLVIHENRGLTEHIRTVAGRFAASGYSALALDLLSEEGGTGAFPDEGAVGRSARRRRPDPLRRRHARGGDRARPPRAEPHARAPSDSASAAG